MRNEGWLIYDESKNVADTGDLRNLQVVIDHDKNCLERFSSGSGRGFVAQVTLTFMPYPSGWLPVIWLRLCQP
jgi:hypothetical protein